MTSLKTLALVLAASLSAMALELSGRVTNPDGSPRSGVSVVLASGGAAATTNGLGEWSLSSSAGVTVRAPRSTLASHLTVVGGRLLFSWEGRDLFGRVSGNAAMRQALPVFAVRAASSAPDTLVYSLDGKVFLRDTVSASRTGINGIYDTTWNGSIIYGLLTDARDSQRYHTVKIGSQIWMAENLNYKVDSSWWFANSADSGAKYGRLYTWAPAMKLPDSCNSVACSTLVQPKHQGICPTGWHVPSGAEWRALTAFVGEDSAGYKLQSTSGWFMFDSIPGTGTDAYGFRALPAGYHWLNGFSSKGKSAWFWSSSEFTLNFALYSYLYAGNGGVHVTQQGKRGGYSIRCLKDDP